MIKRNLLLFLISFYILKTFAQAPQSFQYQAVVRDAAGTALVNQPVNFQVSILSGSITGTVVYSETHTSSTNAYGIVTLNVGGGTPVTGTFSDVNWGSASHYIKVEADPTGGTTYLDMGTTQLLSVPYALYSENTGNIPTYNAGAGIDVTGTTITNTAPDQSVTITGNGATSVTGTYPNFTISSTDNNTTYSAGTGIDVTGATITNTSPDQTVTLTQGGATTVSGTYPNFTISSTDLNTGTPGGLNKTVQYNSNGIFAGDTAAMVWDASNKRMGVGLSNPTGRLVIKGSATAPANEPIFEIKNSLGQQIMGVYNDSIHFYISDIGSNRGGFAVSGRNNAKALTNDFLRINADSTRIYTSDTVKGFSVKNIGPITKTSYMKMTPDNYLIGHQTGNFLTTGKYNSFIGYQAGYSNTIGSNNYFYGYRSGYSNVDGYSNVFMGDSSGFANISGYWNTGIGYKSMKANTTGWNNTALGVYSMFKNTQGNYNTAIGLDALYSNTTGQSNVAIGYNALLVNNGGNNNTAVGTLAFQSGTFFNSTAIGYSANITANNQVVLGNSSVTSLYCQGAYAATSANAANMVVLNTGQILRSTSSKRYKMNIEDLKINTEDIYKLRPVSYISINDNKPYFGLVAEEVAEVIPELAEYAIEKQVVPNSHSDKLIPDAVKYPMLSVLLLNEVQKHQKKIIELNAEIEKLKNENSNMKSDYKLLKAEIEQLKSLLNSFMKK